MKFIQKTLSLFNNFNKLFYSFIVVLFSALFIWMSTSLVLTACNFNYGLENQKKGKHETAIEHYDAVLDYFKYVPAGLDFIASVLRQEDAG